MQYFNCILMIVFDVKILYIAYTNYFFLSVSDHLKTAVMNVIKKIEVWGDHHHPALLDAIRVVLGVFLFVKGFMFMQNTGYLQWILEQQGWLSSGLITVIIYYVISVHMVGGLLIMLGIYTRIMSLLQLPVLIAAILMINVFKSPLNSDMYLSVLTCCLLAMFVVIGSGPFSLDKFLSE